MNKRMRAHFFLLITAFIWGGAFVAQKEGMEHIGPFTFNLIRMIIGGVVLVPVVFFLRKMGITSAGATNDKSITGDPAVTGGLFCGLILFFGASFQQIGIIYTTAGKAGFITALYIVIVPVIGLFLKKKTGKKLWLCVGLAIIGMYFLCVLDGSEVNKGDFIMLFSALGFAAHIMVVDKFSYVGDPVKMSRVQFFVCGALSAPMAIMEAPAISDISEAWGALFFTGVMSCGLAYTLQIVAQRGAGPTIAALIMSFEAVFAVLTGFVILNETLSNKEIAGCLLMFCAIIMAQIPEKSVK